MILFVFDCLNLLMINIIIIYITYMYNLYKILIVKMCECLIYLSILNIRISNRIIISLSSYIDQYWNYLKSGII